MNVASICKAEEVNVKLYFFVKVRKASGRKVAGGSSIGRMLGFDKGATLKDRIGWAGVANAGDEEGMGLTGAGVGGTLKRAATRGSSGRLPVIVAITQLQLVDEAEISQMLSCCLR